MTIQFIHGANHPAVAETYMRNGYGVEIDLRLRDGILYSGHDEPTWIISINQLINKNVLLHAKDISTFMYLNTRGLDTIYHSFFQDKDDVVLTSWGKFVLHSNVRLNRDYNEHEIAVLPTGGYGNAWGVVLDARALQND